ncbi:MAG: hypothetical protein H5T86_08310 [Armatimonadetes bacterium]|nr:hypothetical protein [Armatimonadota bacterium]
MIALSTAKSGTAFSPGIYIARLRGPAGTEETLSFAVLAGLEKILSHEPPAGGVVITDAAVTDRAPAGGTPKLRLTEISGARELYFWFAYDAAVDGTVVEVHWFCNGQLVEAASSRLRLSKGSGTAAAFIKVGAGTLPAGNWSVGAYLEGGSQPLAGLQFRIKSPARSPAGSQQGSR